MKYCFINNYLLIKMIFIFYSGFKLNLYLLYFFNTSIYSKFIFFLLIMCEYQYRVVFNVNRYKIVAGHRTMKYLQIFYNMFLKYME